MPDASGFDPARGRGPRRGADLAILPRLAGLFWRRAAATPGWVEPAVLRRWLAGEGAPIVVDVRGPDEFEGPLGHIDGARNVPLAELPASIPELAAEGRPL